MEPRDPVESQHEMRERRRTGCLHDERQRDHQVPPGRRGQLLRDAGRRFASSHDLGPDPYEGLPDTGSAPDDGREMGGGEDCQGYDPCITPGADVDCAGGSGNGPRYANGPVYVDGADPYDLDRDGNGVGCDD
jgi:hypothetical protein